MRKDFMKCPHCGTSLDEKDNKTDDLKKPSRNMVNEIQNINSRIAGAELQKLFENFCQLYKKRDYLLTGYDWSDQEFEENGKKGVMDCFGEVLVPAAFDEVWLRTSFFVNRSQPVACRKDSNWGMVLPNGEGTLIVDFIYDDILMEEIYSTWSYIVAKKEDKYGILDEVGQELVPLEMDEIYPPKNDMRMLRKGNLFGFIYYNGEYIEPDYDDLLFSLNDNLYHARHKGRWGCISRKGKFVPAEDVDPYSDLYYGSII